MVRAGRSLVGTALGVVVASFLVVVSVPDEAGAANCDLNWSGTIDHESWGLAGNWGGIGTPTATDIVCITTTDHVLQDGGTSHMAELRLFGSTVVEIKNGGGLYVEGGTESVWGPDTHMIVDQGQFGGAGTIRAQGNVTLTAGPFATFLTSKQTFGNGEQPPADRGEMIVEGHATLTSLGLGLLTGYQLSVANGGTFSLAPDAFVAADYGTALTIQPGGVVDLAGDADYHQGFAVTGQPLSVFTNNGLLRKSAGTGTSVVDATYAGSGQVAVQSGTLALPDNQLVGGTVSPGTTLATGRCEDAGSSCTVTTDPAKDTMSVALTVPATNAGPAAVQLQELGPVGAAVDPAAVGNQVLAHADNLAIAGQPARIDLRFSQADVMATPLADVQVVHTTDDGFDVVLPDCANGALPAGLWSCVLRPATRTADNTFVSVLTTTTSRWRVRRGQTVDNQGAATAPQGLTVKEAAPFDGSAWQVSWAPPASSGAGPVASYRVDLDSTQAATATGTSVVLKNPGAGKHSVSVLAVSAAGQGAAASATVTVAALSKPRKVTEVRGAAGGKLTAGAKWKPPADAGGFAITKYKVMVLTAGGKKVDTKVVKAGKHKYLFELKPGRYVFKVRARNSDRWGPWSKPTDAVRPR